MIIENKSMARMAARLLGQPDPYPDYQDLFAQRLARVEDSATRMMVFAKTRHAQQKRKYTNEPYWLHLAEVVGIISSVSTFGTSPGGAPTPPLSIIQSVAWGHDLIEDPGVTREELLAEFDPMVAVGIEWLTDEPVTEGRNRTTRKAADCERLSGAPGWLQSIKCADIISNTSSIVFHDPDFARVYVHEKRRLLDVLDNANPLLRQMAYENSTT